MLLTRLMAALVLLGVWLAPAEAGDRALHRTGATICPAHPGEPSEACQRVPAVRPQASATAYTYRPFDVPLPGVYCCTFVFGITDAGQMVGIYSDMQGILRSFLASPALDRFLRLERPELLSLFVEDINAHLTGVGHFYTIENEFMAAFGFVGDRQGLTRLEIPGGQDVFATGINDHGVIVSFYSDMDWYGHAFVRVADGTITSLDAPGASFWSIARGVNNHGHVVGSYLGEMDGKGFIWREGTWTFVAGPSDTVSSTQLEGINDPGLMVGVWHDNQGQHAFVSDGVTFTELVVPGALYTRVDGINNRGQIVGAYQDAEGGIHGFLAEPAHEAPGQ